MFIPRFSLSSHVRTESLYGMKSVFFFFLLCNKQNINLTGWGKKQLCGFLFKHWKLVMAVKTWQYDVPLQKNLICMGPTWDQVKWVETKFDALLPLCKKCWYYCAWCLNARHFDDKNCRGRTVCNIIKQCTRQKDVKSGLWKESEVSDWAVKGFTLLVQLSCVSRHFKDKRRENRRAYITACQTTNMNSLRGQGQVVEGKKKG